MSKYDDIINLPHWNPKNYSRMSIANRSAQFAPFAALTGYKEEIDETVRQVDRKIILNDDEKEKINRKLLIIEKNIKYNPHVIITHFIKDKNKEGGKYLKEYNLIKKIDKDNHIIVMIDQKKIQFDDILNIELIK